MYQREIKKYFTQLDVIPIVEKLMVYAMVSLSSVTSLD